MNTQEFRIIFQKLRKEQELTQEEIAVCLGISKSSVAMWETGQRLPSPELFEQIADYFNVDIDFLYGRSAVRQQYHYDADGNMQRTLSNEESDLIDMFRSLNEEGQNKVLEYAQDLQNTGRYKKCDQFSMGEKNIG